MGKCDGEKMIALACAVSFQLGQTLNNNDLILLSAFLVVLSDQLALLAETKLNEESC